MSNTEMLSATVVKVGEFAYIFDSDVEASEFFYCVGKHGLEFCFPAYSFKRVPIAEYEPESSSDNDGGGSYGM
ncbi:hypothetical protein [Janthinobacterium sp. DSP2-3-3]|uniref:hypothetical protein n=1 Tax=Janthinobacterium sp. DSP2-3-3 TaxID=2804596 RepID=UPI003CF6C305